MIEVRVRMPQDLQLLTVEIWETEVYRQLKEAGIPVKEDGTLERGSILSVNDPKDWGVRIYKFLPESET